MTGRKKTFCNVGKGLSGGGLPTHITHRFFFRMKNIFGIGGGRAKPYKKYGVFCFVGWQYHLSLRRDILAVIHPSFLKEVMHSVNKSVSN